MVYISKDILGVANEMRNGGFKGKGSFSDDSESGDENDEEQDEVDGLENCLPEVYVQNKPVRFDCITAKLIGQMSDLEKENYINICRELYTEIYD